MPTTAYLCIPLQGMSISDEYMILTIERMQIELRRAMEDIQFLAQELQRRKVSPLVQPSIVPIVPIVPVALVEPLALVEPIIKKRKVIKVKATPVIQAVEQDLVKDSTVKKITAIAPWNAYVAMIRNSMQSDSEEKIKNDDVIVRAKESKMLDPEEYKTFCNDWMANQSH